MENFFKKLQEVTVLPDESHDGDAAAADDAEDLKETLQATKRELEVVTGKFHALQSESASLNEEYTAYKAKVQTWREQMRVARAQDRKTIELLRQTGGSSKQSMNAEDNGSGAASTSGSGLALADGSGSSTVGSGAHVEEVYVKSLEEQVRQLKESLRQYGEERDKVRLELKRTKEMHATELERLQAPTTSAVAGSSTASAVASYSSGDDGERLRLQLLVDAKEEQLRHLTASYKELEKKHEHLLDESRQSNDAVASTEEQLREELHRAQMLLENDRQVHYIRSLESEVRMWKTEAQIAKGGLTPIVPSSHFDSDTGKDHQSANDEGNSASRQSRAHQEEVEKAQRQQIDQQERLIQQLRLQLADLSVESSLREESIDRMYNDCRTLELSLAAAREEISAHAFERAEWCNEKDVLTRELSNCRQDKEEFAERVASLDGQYAKLQKEFSTVNETVRALKLDLAKRLVVEQQAAQVMQRTSAQPSSHTTVAGGSDNGGVASDGGSAPALPSAFGGIQSSLQNIRVVQQQVHAVWTKLNAQRKNLTTYRRWYVLIVLFVMLGLLFSLYQAVGVIDESNEMDGTARMAEALRACKAQLQITAAGGAAVKGVS